jgi:VWFA-related protein
MKFLARQAVLAALSALTMFAAAFLHAQPLGAAKASTPANTSPTFKSNARLVLVDVVATDDNGQPVHSLGLQDFTLIEDGKPQRISGFQEQRSDAKPKTPPPPLNLPENVHTNFVSRSDGGALTVLLFDALNTDRQHLTYAKQEMLNFLKSLPPGKRVALFTLGERLRMVQSFTENTDALIAAAQDVSSSPLVRLLAQMSCPIPSES